MASHRIASHCMALFVGPGPVSPDGGAHSHQLRLGLRLQPRPHPRQRRRALPFLPRRRAGAEPCTPSLSHQASLSPATLPAPTTLLHPFHFSKAQPLRVWDNPSDLTVSLLHCPFPQRLSSPGDTLERSAKARLLQRPSKQETLFIPSQHSVASSCKGILFAPLFPVALVTSRRFYTARGQNLVAFFAFM